MTHNSAFNTRIHKRGIWTKPPTNNSFESVEDGDDHGKRKSSVTAELLLGTAEEMDGNVLSHGGLKDRVPK